MRPDLLSALNAARRERRAAVLVTAMAGGEQRLVTPATLAEDPSLLLPEAAAEAPPFAARD